MTRAAPITPITANEAPAPIIDLQPPEEPVPVVVVPPEEPVPVVVVPPEEPVPVVSVAAGVVVAGGAGSSPSHLA